MYKKKCIRVLQVIDRLELNSGVSSVVMNYYNHMDKSDIIFDFLVHGSTDNVIRKNIESKGSRIYEMPRLCAKNILMYYKKLNLFFKEKASDYDIIHGHIPNAAVFYLGLAKKYNVSVRIIHSHSSIASENVLKRFRNRVLINLGIKQANCYFACSNSAALYMYGKKMNSSKKVRIIYNAIDTDRFAYNEDLREKVRKNLGIENRFVLGHVGRFTSNKNQEFLIDLIKDLDDERVLLLLIGDGEKSEIIKKKVKKYQLYDQVVFLGIRDDVEIFLQAMDLFLLPSYHEGLPVSCIEAQFSGLNCLISDSVTKETDISGNCYYLDIGDRQSWLKCIKTYMNNCENMKRKVCNTNQFNIENETIKLLNLYKQLLFGWRKDNE